MRFSSSTVDDDYSTTTEKRSDAHGMSPDEIHARFLAIAQRAFARVEADLGRLRAPAPRGEGRHAYHRRFVGSTTRRAGRQPDAALERFPDDATLDLLVEEARARFNRRGDEPT